MDLRTRTSLFCGALALAIAVSILLRGRPRRPQLFFAGFAADIGLWYLAQWLYHFVRAGVWAHFTAFLAVLLPQFALHLFEAIVPAPTRRSRLLQVARILGVPMLVLVLSPQHELPLVRAAVFLYVFGLIAAGLWSLALRAQRSNSRAIQRRVRFLVLIGALATLFTAGDFMWFIGAPLPPVGAVLSIVFLFVLSESLTRDRLVDLYDILGKLLVSTALAFCLAGIFYVFVVLVGGFSTMYLNAILASIVILVLFEPLREKVEEYIHRIFFLERADLDKAVARAGQELVHVLQVDEMTSTVLNALESSRRTTGAALYLREPQGADFVLQQSFGKAVPTRLEGAAGRALLEHLAKHSSAELEQLEREASDPRRPERLRRRDGRVLAAAEVLGPLRRGMCLGVRGDDGELLAVLVVVDDRMRDAFSPEEVTLLEGLAVQIGVVLENSRVYRVLQERDRLAALGQMAAGLAHEVKNPLGAIKGAAQLLAEPGDDQSYDREFVDIILEEVDRLDRVVGSVLDYGRPSKGDPSNVEVNSVVERTVQLLRSDPATDIELEMELGDALPAVRVDTEQLHQVLINLVQNAIQAKASRIVLRTRGRLRQGEADWVEVAVLDNGPGIAPSVMKNLFVPFFTTRDKGTGLGLAISERMVQEMGGRIEVASQEQAGATFTIVLPSAESLTPRAPSVSRPTLSGETDVGDVAAASNKPADILPI